MGSYSPDITMVISYNNSKSRSRLPFFDTDFILVSDGDVRFEKSRIRTRRKLIFYKSVFVGLIGEDKGVYIFATGLSKADIHEILRVGRNYLLCTDYRGPPKDGQY